MANKNPQNKPEGMCKWFLLCRESAVTKVSHPVLGSVACCAACAKRAG